MNDLLELLDRLKHMRGASVDDSASNSQVIDMAAISTLADIQSAIEATEAVIDERKTFNLKT